MMADIKQIPGAYYERANPMAISYKGTADTGISTNDNDEMIITVPSDGKYMVLAKGTYMGHAYCVVDIVLYIYQVQNNRMLARQVVVTNYNYIGTPSSVVKFVLDEPLCKHDKIELRFGNINHTPGANDAQQSFSYAAPGDYLALIRVS